MDDRGPHFNHISVVLNYLGTLGADARLQHPGIGPRRGDLIMAGFAVLDAVCRRWPVGHLMVADRGIREGILTSLMIEDGITLTRQGANRNGTSR